MKNKFYEVKLYMKRAVFDKNLHLVWRWYLIDKSIFTSQRRAMKHFSAYKRIEHYKPVLRLTNKAKRR